MKKKKNIKKRKEICKNKKSSILKPPKKLFLQKNMFYDQVSNTLARSLTERTVSDLYFQKDLQSKPVRKDWGGNLTSWRHQFWDYAIQVWGWPVDPQQLQLRQGVLLLSPIGISPALLTSPPLKGTQYELEESGELSFYVGKELPNREWKHIIVMTKMVRDDVPQQIDTPPPFYTAPSDHKKLFHSDISLNDIMAPDTAGSPRAMFFVSDNITNAKHPAVAHGFRPDYSSTVENMREKYIQWLQRVKQKKYSQELYSTPGFVETWVDGPRLYFFTWNPLLEPIVYKHLPIYMRLFDADDKTARDPFRAVFFANEEKSDRPTRITQGFKLRDGYDLDEVKEAYCAWLSKHNQGVGVKCHSCWEEGQVEMWVSNTKLFFFLTHEFSKVLRAAQDLRKNDKKYPTPPQGKFFDFPKILQTGAIVNSSVRQPYHDFRVLIDSPESIFDPNTWFSFMSFLHPNFCFKDDSMCIFRTRPDPAYEVLEHTNVNLHSYPSRPVEREANGLLSLYTTKDEYYFTKQDFSVNSGTLIMCKMDGYKEEWMSRMASQYVNIQSWEPIPPTIVKTYQMKTKGIVVPKNYLQINEQAFVHEVRSCQQRFVIKSMNIRGTSNGKDWAHTNGLVVDMETGTLSRYEPHGAQTNDYDNRMLDHLLSELVQRHPRTFFGGYESPLQFCPEKGPQWLSEASQRRLNLATKFDENGSELKEIGWCAAFSAMFLHFRVSNPDLTTREVAKKLSSGDGAQLSEDVRSYINFMILNTKEAQKK
jgi:hypothetical protein